jgi:hypothetical protein
MRFTSVDLPCRKPRIKLAVFWLVILIDVLTGFATPTPSASSSAPEFGISNPSSYGDIENDLQQRADPDVLPSHYWTLAKNQGDIEAFRAKYGLTLVTSVPQDAALLPSWPQALLQYFFISPFFDCTSSSHTFVNGMRIGGWNFSCVGFIQYLLAPPCFIAWIISFAQIQNSGKPSGGWISVLGWTTWLCLAGDVRGQFAWPPLIIALFQWVSSLAIIIQRWKRSVGSVAYEIVNTNGCTPYDGLSFLESGVRSRAYRIFQTTSFACGTFVCPFLLGQEDIAGSVNTGMCVIAFAELVYSCVVATKGMPMVVSGNCLLVELNPRLGYLDSSISTSWKALSGFMGF